MVKKRPDQFHWDTGEYAFRPDAGWHPIDHAWTDPDELKVRNRRTTSKKVSTTKTNTDRPSNNK